MTPLFNITDKEFELLRKLVYDSVGINLTEVKKPLLASRLSSRLRAYEFQTYLEYYEFVTRPENQDEKQIMIDFITTNETSFFREMVHFNFLQQKVLKEFEKDTIIRIWSAACSSGEEPFSIGMMLASELNNRKRWEIIASDISSRILDRCKRALYPMDKSEKIPEKYLKKYCLKGVRTNEGLFKISREILDFIQFKQINLIEQIPNIGTFQVIFLRNVMIYFDKPTRKKIVNSLSQRLISKGYLFIGHSETLIDISDDFQMILPTIYRKK